MADINIQIKQKNGAIWDSLYPKTKADLVIENANKRFVSDAEKATWNGKQDKLSYTPVNVTDKNVANGWVGLGSDVKIPRQFLPDITITDTFVVASQSSMLALTAQIGDIAIRTDENKSYILASEPSNTLANWQVILTPTADVTSVNGKKGVVTISKTDVGLGSVDNESKSTMFNNPTFTGNVKAPNPIDASSDTTVATTKFVQDAIKKKSSIVVSTTEPINPTDKDLWYEII